MPHSTLSDALQASADGVEIEFDLSPGFRATGLWEPPLVWGDPVGRAVREAVFARDQYTCRCCGFRAERYQTVLARSGNLRDIDAMLTTCTFCYQCLRLDLVPQMESGILIWLPEVSQAAVHHMARYIYAARIRQRHPTAAAASTLLEQLMERRNAAQDRIGSEDPVDLIKLLRDAVTASDRVALHRRLEGIRLFPHNRMMLEEANLRFNQFPQIIAYWRSRKGPLSVGVTQDDLQVIAGRLQVRLATPSDDAP